MQFLVRTRQTNFFAMWEKAERPFEAIEARKGEIAADGFWPEYRGLIAGFQKFAEAQKLEVTKDQYVPIVFNRLTQVITVSVFAGAHPELTARDARMAEMIESQRERLFEMNAQPFLEAFRANPKLLGLAAEYLGRAFREESAIQIAQWIDKALSTMIHVLSFQGYREIGADHWLPITLYLFTFLNPPRIVSVIEYMNYVLLKLKDYGPVSQSQEYNVTMAHSAGQYFGQRLTEWESGKMDVKDDRGKLSAGEGMSILTPLEDGLEDAVDAPPAVIATDGDTPPDIE
jgi:hypothetical protein